MEEGIVNAVSVTEQTLSEEQKALARENIGAIGESVVTAPLYLNHNIRAIAHRGYSVEAPENTLAAYRLAREKGFTYVECDVAVTSDGVPVLLHDNTIDRTSNGTGHITALTFEQVRALDFGSWYSPKYAGEKIPTLEEFVIFCKWNGLHPYIEIKSNVPVGQIPTIVGVVRRYDMLRNVTWISFSSALLEAVKAEDAKARLGYVVGEASSSYITWATSAKTDNNEVFIDLYYEQVTDAFAAECAEAGIPLEVWTINSAEAMAALDPYVSGFTSDSVRANVALYGAAVPESEEPEPEGMELVRTVASSEILIGSGNNVISPYYAANAPRSIYPNFDILLESGYRYTVIADFNETVGVKFAHHLHNQRNIDRASAGQALATTDVLDPGWQPGNTVTFCVDEIDINGLPPAAMRFIFARYDGSDMQDGDIIAVRIYREKV